MRTIRSLQVVISKLQIAGKAGRARVIPMYYTFFNCAAFSTASNTGDSPYFSFSACLFPFPSCAHGRLGQSQTGGKRGGGGWKGGMGGRFKV